GGVELFRAGNSAADADLGRDAERRGAKEPRDGAVSRDLSGCGDQPRGAGVQHAGRRLARPSGSSAAEPLDDVARACYYLEMTRAIPGTPVWDGSGHKADLRSRRLKRKRLVQCLPEGIQPPFECGFGLQY